ncbi:MAG TPA: hypothetical protein VLW85_17920 [Myxococcales bacterium]|nr:hypothetical protein [Myxococcales bacterium]
MDRRLLPTLSGVMALVISAPAAAQERVPADQQGRLDDANIDRGWFGTTAMTQPAGTVAFNDYELILMGLTYAPTDRLQITATFLTPIVSDMCCYGLFGVKARLVDAGRFHFSLLGSLALASVQNVDLYGNGSSSGRGTSWAILAGGAATVCLDEACHSLASAWLTTGFNQYSDSSEWPILYGASLTFGHHVKALLEIDSAALLGDVTQAARGALFTYGVRFTGQNIAGDVGFMRPFGEGVDTGSLVLGIPMLTFTWRTF